MTVRGTAEPAGAQLSARLWLAAAAELAVAAAVGALLLQSNAAAVRVHHGMHGTRHDAEINWTTGFFVSVTVAAALLLWWIPSRNRVVAIMAAAGLVAVAASEPVRTLALQSHLVAMATLELAMVAAPLLLVAALRGSRLVAKRTARSNVWPVWVIAATLANSLFLVGLHLPGGPSWSMGLAVVIGFGYWAAILLADEAVPLAGRRAALVIGQEVAAILGLAAIILPIPHAQHGNPLGLSAAADQRLGGALMLITCAAVTLSLTKRSAKEPVPDAVRTESHVN